MASSNPLDPERVKAALAACEQEERAGDDLARESRRLYALAAARRQRWGLPPRPVPPISTV